MTERTRPVWVLLAVAVVGGVLLGAVDLIAQRELPYPWANLANSSAVWAVGAFAIGRWVGPALRVRPALAGAVLLLVAVESYYLTATLVQNDALSNLWSPSTLLWLAFGVLAGVIFGTAGGWSGASSTWRRMLGSALPGAVLLAEAAVYVYRSGGGDAAYRTDSLQTAAIEAALGLALPFVLGGSLRHRLAVLATSLPVALGGFGAFVLAGYGG